jgi:hypothetical protein
LLQDDEGIIQFQKYFSEKRYLQKQKGEKNLQGNTDQDGPPRYRAAVFSEYIGKTQQAANPRQGVQRISQGKRP